ncbi:S-formylglutathione hydrolase [Almyronema epifaneia]|uniref:S-formylglutathione hydrolase n=1 Tax=Almyronema epifaneia S1 TaxID=2991925 RepID=A0ABW6IFV3_9CYAN
MSQAFEQISEQLCFGGTVGIYRHTSSACNCDMRFAAFVPPQAKTQAVPVLYYLSGLTCTEENFITKAGAQRYAAEQGLVLVAPDTSPRGEAVPDEDTWDFGKGAGFYLNATQSPWQTNYRMYSYVVEELPALIAANFPVRGDRAGILGHSMGGHGALICGLKNPEKFRSISAFAPIAAPSRCPWGQKAFTQYLGEDQSAWKDYDASELVLHKADPSRLILIDQGTGDNFYQQGQLLPEAFQIACEQAGQPLSLRMQVGYDHSYYFIATFMGDHIQHHAQALYA